MTTTDPRARLAEVQERAESVHETAGRLAYRIYLDGNSAPTSAQRIAATAFAAGYTEGASSTYSPAMAAALTAVLDLMDKVADEDEITTQADGVHVPVYLVRAAITDALGGDRG